MQPDMVVLAAPEIADLPYVISGLITAGALAAALSTADGLLLTIANALSHDVYYCMVDRRATNQRRVTISSKILLLGVGAAGVVCRFAQYREHSVSGERGVFIGGVESVPCAGTRRVLEAHHAARRGCGSGLCIYYIVSTYPFFMQLTGFAGPR